MGGGGGGGHNDHQHAIMFDLDWALPQGSDNLSSSGIIRIRTFSCRLNAHSWWRHQMETFSALLAFVRGIHRSPANSPHKGQWPGVLMFSLICVWINDWVNNRDAGELRRHCGHYDVTVMSQTDWAIQDQTKQPVTTMMGHSFLRRRRRATPYFFSTSCYLIRMT